MNAHSVDTIAALATPLANSAVGVVRLSGPDALSIANLKLQLLHSKSLRDASARKMHLAYLLDGKKVVDQVLVCVFLTPHSFTGEDMVEISCHGSPVVLESALRALTAAGARLAEPGEFSKRAFLNGKLDLAQAEAVADLISSQTELARAAALEQLQGNISRKIREWRDDLLNVAAHLEVELDHSDDDTVGTALSQQQRGEKLAKIAEQIQTLSQTFSYGKLIKEGARLVLVGKPNVGKSSLLNALLQNDRAIVTPVAGTTRDSLEERFNLHGIPCVLVDTAGIRSHASDMAERFGIERSRQALQKSDVAIFVVDASAPLDEEDQRVYALVQNARRWVLAINKEDLPEAQPSPQILQSVAAPKFARISCQTGAGIDELLQILRVQLLKDNGGQTSASQELVVSSLRHEDCLRRAYAALERAINSNAQPAMEECTALEMQEALLALGEIIGETTSEDILSAIFSQFCIGK